ncbi:MAG: hypothetical protein L3J97_01385, partial [Thermoplasmata archaeon]|nr:hypothetical protein [Thermoplasmata archaeon]
MRVAGVVIVGLLLMPPLSTIAPSGAGAGVRHPLLGPTNIPDTPAGGDQSLAQAWKSLPWAGHDERSSGKGLCLFPHRSTPTCPALRSGPPLSTGSGESWVNVTPLVVPPGRDSAMMAYDASDGCVLMFGGEAVEPLNDTW